MTRPDAGACHAKHSGSCSENLLQSAVSGVNDINSMKGVNGMDGDLTRAGCFEQAFTQSS